MWHGKTPVERPALRLLSKSSLIPLEGVPLSESRALSPISAIFALGLALGLQTCVRFSEEGVSHRRSPKLEDPLKLQSHQRMEDLAERGHRQFVAHNVFDGCRSAIVAEPMGMLPDVVGTAQLLVHKPDRRLPA